MEKKPKNTAIYVAYEDQEPFDPSLPEKNLLRAILSTAMSDVKKTGESGRKAVQYFLDPDDAYIFSFRSICNHLDLDPKTIIWVVGLDPSNPKPANPASKSDSPPEIEDAPK